MCSKAAAGGVSSERRPREEVSTGLRRTIVWCAAAGVGREYWEAAEEVSFGRWRRGRLFSPIFVLFCLHGEEEATIGRRRRGECREVATGEVSLGRRRRAEEVSVDRRRCVELRLAAAFVRLGESVERWKFGREPR